MKLTFILATLTSTLYTAFAFDGYYYKSHSSNNQLVKRDHGLPYDTLPTASNCAVPPTCSKIPGNVTCRCSDTLTTCINNSGQYCWGSISLNSTSCPTMPNSCTSTFTGTTTSCLCNDKNILCVDNANNYCYGSITNGNTVAVTAIPYAPSTPITSSAAATNNAAPTMSVVGAPSNAATAVPTTTTSGSAKALHVEILSGFICAFVAYTVSSRF
ncbi:hypothetical protein BDF20DRAFT_881885 [Mycotypha africana]|uniref:uncharacterized protein n=1 Tax=Mycotypha africana TaxID=64632 RepID=UPI002300503A|nr:uncharacterized protein BDF20DRAFT_881885 [Mycotypha africana]KAI8973345.1 hypothetical protein BDF20DRAFT_881885 [Mycotypha africana]